MPTSKPKRTPEHETPTQKDPLTPRERHWFARYRLERFLEYTSDTLAEGNRPRAEELEDLVELAREFLAGVKPYAYPKPRPEAADRMLEHLREGTPFLRAWRECGGMEVMVERHDDLWFDDLRTALGHGTLTLFNRACERSLQRSGHLPAKAAP